MKVKIIIGVLLLLLLGSGYCLNRQNNSINDLNNILASTNRKLSSYVDENGKLNTRISVLSLSNTNLLKNLDTKDSMYLRLRNSYNSLHKKNTKLESIIATNTITLIQYKDSLYNTIIKLDSVLENGEIVYYPTYKRSIDMFDKWITGDITLGYNTTDINIAVKSEHDITIFRERKNIFSSYSIYANVKLNNPYDVTEDFVVFFKDKAENKFNISLSGGLGYGNGFGPIVGVTVGYTLISF